MSGLPASLLPPRAIDRQPQRLGQAAEWYAALPSTNSLAMARLGQGAEEGLLILTDDQQAGRGQQGNQWLVAPGQNLTFSVVLRPQRRPEGLFILSKVVALALHDLLRELLPQAEVLIKWPNDLLVDRKKIAGILIENQWEGGHLKGIVVGIGLNVNQAEFPPEIAGRTVSLRLATGQHWGRGEVLWRALQLLEGRYAQWEQAGNAALDRAYLQALYGYQEPVPLRWADGEGRYPILGISPHGHLVVQLSSGLRHFDLKEVTFLWDSQPTT